MIDASAKPGAHAAQHTTRESVKETLISIIIAFVLAFVFRSFVIEAFIIPTGSMAPTLLGAHMRFDDRQTGDSWAVGPRDFADAGFQEPMAFQGAPWMDPKMQRLVDNPIVVHEPFTGAQRQQANVPRRAGDRILVLKFLYLIRDPEPFDVVVFKNPGTPLVNYIKRLLAVPGEQVALVDGDVFVRQSASPAAGDSAWDEPGWKIRRKPSRVERAVWQPVFDSSFAPAEPATLATYRVPWKGGGPGTWTIGAGDRTLKYSATSAGPATLSWDDSAPWIAGQSKNGMMIEPRRSRELCDRYPYNEGTPGAPYRAVFPVSDLRLRAAVRFDAGAQGGSPSDGARIAGVITTRGHEFVGEVMGGKARVKMRPQGRQGQPEAAWTTLAETDVKPITPGNPYDFEFWHCDQRLSVYIDGSLAVQGEYSWGPAERVAFSTGRSLADLLSSGSRSPGNPLADPAIYTSPSVRFELSGGSLSMSRVAIDRDLYYQPAVRGREPARATHPATTMTLGPDQFFVCGDNSPASEDGRLWRDPDPWVAQAIDETPGIVPRRLLLGKAFFVYFPALAGTSPVPMPDFGRMRFIQ